MSNMLSHEANIYSKSVLVFLTLAVFLLPFAGHAQIISSSTYSSFTSAASSTEFFSTSSIPMISSSSPFLVGTSSSSGLEATTSPQAAMYSATTTPPLSVNFVYPLATTSGDITLLIRTNYLADDVTLNYRDSVQDYSGEAIFSPSSAGFFFNYNFRWKTDSLANSDYTFVAKARSGDKVSSSEPIVITLKKLTASTTIATSTAIGTTTATTTIDVNNEASTSLEVVDLNTTSSGGGSDTVRTTVTVVDSLPSIGTSEAANASSLAVNSQKNYSPLAIGTISSTCLEKGFDKKETCEKYLVASSLSNETSESVDKLKVAKNNTAIAATEIIKPTRAFSNLMFGLLLAGLILSTLSVFAVFRSSHRHQIKT